MVTVSHRPIKEVVILDYVKFPNAQELVKNMVIQPGAPAVLYWAEGVVFLPVPLNPNNEKVVEELIEGRVYWMVVSFAPMPTYSSMLSAEKGPEALVVNVSRSKTLSSVARWLKERLAEGP
jgi:hypothetical protein